MPIRSFRRFSSLQKAAGLLSGPFARPCLGAVFLLFLAAAVTSCAADEKKGKEAEPRRVAVTVAAGRSVPDTMEYFGVVTAGEVKKYSFESAGTIGEIRVEEGDRVREGQVLAVLDPVYLRMAYDNAKLTVGSAQAAADAVEVQLRQQRANLGRYRKLQAGGALAKAEMEASETGVRALEKQLAAAKSAIEQARIGEAKALENLEKGELRSDMDGHVAIVTMKQGEITGAGVPVVVVKDDRKTVSVGLSTSDYAKFSAVTGASADGMTAKILSAASYPDESTRTYKVKLELSPGSAAVPGDIIPVSLECGERSGVFVPLSAVFSSEGLDYVFAVNSEGIAERVRVIRGAVRNDEVAVDGIAQGMTIVREGQKYLRDNEKVVPVFSAAASAAQPQSSEGAE